MCSTVLAVRINESHGCKSHEPDLALVRMGVISDTGHFLNKVESKKKGRPQNRERGTEGLGFAYFESPCKKKAKACFCQAAK